MVAPTAVVQLAYQHFVPGQAWDAPHLLWVRSVAHGCSLVPLEYSSSRLSVTRYMTDYEDPVVPSAAESSRVTSL